MKNSTSTLLLLLGSFVFAHAGNPMLSIEVNQPIGKSSPMLYGLMTEEINHSYDGGLYAELVQNRTFLDDPHVPVHWSATGKATIALDPRQPLNTAIPTSLRVEVPVSGGGVVNDGYWGFPVKPATTYRARFFAKAAPGFTGRLTVALGSANGATVYAQASTLVLDAVWKQYNLTLTTDEAVKPTTLARLALTTQQPGTVWLGLVSLFPPTWNDRPNGLRRDLMQMLVDLKPTFLRFPGGNYLEGDTLATRFDWKKTLGPITERPGHEGPWKYRSSDGMGLMEFLLWCEDMQAEPVLAVYAGYSFKEPAVRPGPTLAPMVQDALDEIEYVTGPVASKWGAQRARDGHPNPFKLRYLEIGNEDFFDRSGSYDGRFAQFYDAIKQQYPEIECISSIGYTNTPLNGLLSSRKPELMDNHFYRSTDEFLKLSADFDKKYDRNGPEVFAGEWAAHEDGKIKPWSKAALKQPPTPSMKAAIGDAAFMAALERNSDIIKMHCYAPLLVNVNPGAWQWRPDMIGYDSLHAFGSPSYYAFQMFSCNRGDEILKTITTDTTMQVSATRDSKSGEIILKLVNPEETAQPLKIDLRGVRSLASTATATTLAADPNDTNTPDEPTKVVPVTSQVSGIAPTFTHTFAPNSITILRLDASK